LKKNASDPHVDDKNPKNDVGVTPLHIAAEEGNFEKV
jgi:ankyrin repeat protein